ncbi:MAG: PKD domain-containing protein, partial [Candidatus Hydrogenedentota bacterium]
SNSFDVDGDALAYTWRFASQPADSEAVLDDSTAVRPAFTIDAPGDYVLELIVNDGQVNSDPDTAIVTTANSAPVADAGPDTAGQVGDTIVLDGSNSFDVDGDALAYAWGFTARPSGSSASLDTPTAVSPSFTVDEPGDYVIQLVVNDGAVSSPPDAVRISTTNTAPVADAGPDMQGFLDDEITLDGSGSSDVDGDQLTYSWSFVSQPSGSSATLDDNTLAKPSFVIDAPGDYVLQLVVSDGMSLSEADSVTVSTLNTPPVADAGADQSHRVGTDVTLDGTGSSDSEGDPLTFAWSFVEQPEGSEAVLTGADTVAPSFTIDAPGEYVVQLVVSDEEAESDPDTVVITTRNSRPVADAGNNRAVVAGDTVVLDGRDSSDPDNDPLTYVWSLIRNPEDSTATLSDADTVRPSFTTDLFGVYVAQLIVNDGALNSSSDTVTIVAGDIDGGCIDPPAPPSNVSATDGEFPDFVRITWDAVSDAEEYRVYRADANDPTTASAISAWIEAASYDDTSAAAPPAPPCGGCFEAAEPGATYFYWVRSRSAENCAGAFSTVDEGFAGPHAKRWPMITPVFVPALPGAHSSEPARPAPPGATLFVRLRTEAGNIDPDSVAAEMHVDDVVHDAGAVWRPASSDATNDGWVECAMPPELPEGVTIHLHVAAANYTGETVAERSVTYVCTALPDDLAPVWQPDYSDFDARAMDATREGNDAVTLATVDDATWPAPEGSFGPVYRVGPEAAFALPQRVWFPLPAGTPQMDVRLFYYLDDGGQARWQPAEEVAGWIDSTSYLVLEIEGVTYFGVLMHHGGYVRLGPPHHALAPSSLAPQAWIPPQTGNVLLTMLALGLVFALAQAMRRKPAGRARPSVRNRK